MAAPLKGIFKFDSIAGRKIRILPEKKDSLIIDFVDQPTSRHIFYPTKTIIEHRDGECFLCDHEDEIKYNQFRAKIMAEAITEL
jgi:hypothetical protein